VLPGIGSYSGSDKTALGEGALFSLGGLLAITSPSGSMRFVITTEAGTASTSVGDEVQATLTNGPLPDGLSEPVIHVMGRNRPSDIVGLGRMRQTPLLLAGLLVALVAATVANALLLAVRRRRFDLAILKTLGATRRQVFATVGWQATTVAVIALIIGLPLGVALGNWSWIALEHALGLVADPVVPWVALGVTSLVVIVLANLIGLLAGVRAARSPASATLRSE
jgi:hypothetical protein